MRTWVRSEVPLHEDCNLTREQADVLIRKYLDTPINQYFEAKFPIRDGQIYAILMNRDELTTNEKVFLVAIAAKAITITNLRNAYEEKDHTLFLEMIGAAVDMTNNGEKNVNK